MKQYVVIGMGKFGQSLALELAKMGHEVLGVDIDEASLLSVQDHITHVIVADATNEEAIESLGIENFDCAIIAIGDVLQNSILAAINCKDMGVNAVWAKATTKTHARVLEKIGVDRVIFPEQEMGIRTAHLLDSNNVLDYIALSNEYQLLEIITHDKWVGKTLGELNFRRNYGVTVIAVRGAEAFEVSPDANYQINPADVLVVVGKAKDLDKL